MSKNIILQQKTPDGFEELLPKVDAYSHSETLTNNTKTYLSLPATATPDDAFRKLGEIYQYCWKRRSVGHNIITSPFSASQPIKAGSVNYYSKEIYVDQNNLIQLQDPINFSYSANSWSSASNALSTICNNSPCYIRYQQHSSSTWEIAYIPARATYGETWAPDTDRTLTYSDAQGLAYICGPSQQAQAPGALKVTATVIYGDWEEIYSPNRNAHPDSGVVDGYEYEFIGRLIEKTVEKLQPWELLYSETKTYNNQSPNPTSVSTGAVFSDLQAAGKILAKRYDLIKIVITPNLTTSRSSNSSCNLFTVSANNGSSTTQYSLITITQNTSKAYTYDQSYQSSIVYSKVHESPDGVRYQSFAFGGTIGEAILSITTRNYTFVSVYDGYYNATLVTGDITCEVYGRNL